MKVETKVDSKRVSMMFKALSDEVRVKILCQLMENEQCACYLLKKQKIDIFRTE